jgi:hypothetical protein
MIVKQLVLILLISFVGYGSSLEATTIQDTVVVNQREMRSCQDTTYLIHKVYTTPLQATIVRNRPSGWLYMRCPAISEGMDLQPCYLPVQACEEGLIVLITGNVLMRPLGRNTDCRTTLPFQLTSLKIVRP